MVSSKLICNNCFGTGYLLWTTLDTCPDCKGKGYIYGKKYSTRVGRFFKNFRKG